MPASLPLLSRLRHRSRGAGWLCVLLLVLKLVVAAGCVGDTVTAQPLASASVTALASAHVASSAAAGDDATATCWHSGDGDCHCNCVHTLPLASHAWSRVPLMRPAVTFASVLPALYPPVARNELRPPIA